MSQIYDNLYLGNITTSRDQAFFKKNNIKNVLVAGKNLKRSFINQCKYHQLQISDNPTTIILKYWPESVQFLSTVVGNTLVHCQGGKSRSASTVMAYVVFKENITAQESITKVRKLHKFAYPNPGFLKQLEYWEDIVKEYKKINSSKASEDFKLLDELTSAKLNEVTQLIINPSQQELTEANQKLNFFEDFEQDQKTDKIFQKSNNKKQKKENQALKDKIQTQFENEYEQEDNEQEESDDIFEDEQDQYQLTSNEDYLNSIKKIENLSLQSRNLEDQNEPKEEQKSQYTKNQNE
ncbi:dual specificity phosphatase domain protein (macronuclear) [Tetrahymena thermophila SB210]|uniref:protein-tyrosine-phosphatase n=1 Tax=Tetrahymena thermophila (strain SB210) TaxID=312017 RepID=Q22VY8_TETTS|nr:dual specificity phosphatase domain protein [Tetrahymena thermophila SB210]EAR89628.1 dual specificity phosphatase domain protein [Tetrahymena thermophila SB210]|eukprot:XP_001009874.1 dual specificity phosphatase domain protein [Tetrahymena thermophila SB210]